MKVLLINPPVYDFAAYDFWMKPLGLLYISSILKKMGHDVHLIDVMDRNDSYYTDVKSDRYGRGKFETSEINKPDILKNIPRKYKRYGLPKETVKKRIIDIHPDIVMVTCTMTYWYPGVIEIRDIIREVQLDVHMILGGIYVSLLPEHAKSLGFDDVYTIRDRFINIVEVAIPDDFKYFPAPDYSLYDSVEYVAIATSFGCSYQCPYCSADILYNGKQDKKVNRVVEEIQSFSKKGVRRFAFYDDALLIQEDRFLEICDNLIERRIPALYFTPNGLHSRFLSKEVASRMKKAGFREPRISLETSDIELQKKFNLKTTYNEFRVAVDNLLKAGFDKKEIYAYLLAGLPDQSFDSVKKSIFDVARAGVKVSLSEYSPIPGTLLGEELLDPLLTNNTAYYYYKGMGREMEEVKMLTRWVNNAIDMGISIDDIKDYL